MKEPTQGRGITRTKTILALILVLLVAVGAYGVLNFQRQSSINNDLTTNLSTQLAASTLSGNGSRHSSYLLDFFGNFSRMAVADVVNNPDEALTAENVSYAVLGHTLVNSTDYLRVAFTVAPGNSTTTLWFDQRGSVGVAQVGHKNYTGTLAEVQSGFLTSYFSSTSVDGNGTQLSGLQKTGEALQDIGPTQMSVSTYELPPSSASTLAVNTVKIAAIPGTNVRLLVYLNQVPSDPNGTTELFQVISISMG